MTEQTHKYNITIVLKPSLPGQRQYILVCSPDDDENAIAPAGWTLRSDYHDIHGYTATFTRLATGFAESNTVTVSLIYSPDLTTVTEIFSK